MKESEIELAEKLARLLTLLEPTREEVLARHGATIDAWVRACTGDPQPTGGNLFELCRGWIVRLRPNMEEFQAGLGVLSGGIPSATRSATTKGAGHEAAGRECGTPAASGGRFIARGERCVGELLVHPQPDGRLTLEFSLQDEQWNPINPFVLTVRQPAAVLLDRKRIDGDRYEVKDIPPAAYAFELADLSGRRRVEMGWTAA